MAAATLTVIPILLIYFVFRKEIIRGLRRMVSKDKTSITFHSGILTIGGTVIEVAYKDSHIFSTSGLSFYQN